MNNPYQEYLKMVMSQLSSIVFNCSQIKDGERVKNLTLDKLIDVIEEYNSVTRENIKIVDYRKRG